MDSATNQHGTREVRLEDDALVRGHGRFVDDARFPNQAFAVFVRSPHAFARIVSIDSAAARASKGVLAVLTAADMNEAGLKTAGRHPPIKGRGGKDLIQPFRPTLAGERVLYVGEAVAMVVAETVGQAQDGADLVTVEYEEQPAVVGPRDALKPGAPQLHPEASGNVAIDWPGMAESAENERDVDAAINGAAHVARVTVVNQRLIVATMETRGANASYDAKTDSYSLRACSQSAGVVRNQTAPVLGLDNSKLRVTTEDVGGAFCMKTPVYP
jgi:carbon-monoxide dehydrogenase large subunit